MSPRFFPSFTAMTVITAICAAVALTLGGCASTHGIGAQARIVEPAAVGMSVEHTAPPVQADWWQAWHDTTLDGLVDRALADNPNLKSAQARVARAQAAAGLAQANRLPLILRLSRYYIG